MAGSITLIPSTCLRFGDIGGNDLNRQGQRHPPMPPTVDSLGRREGKKEWLGWVLVSGFLCTFWFLVFSLISCILNVLVGLGKIGSYLFVSG